MTTINVSTDSIVVENTVDGITINVALGATIATGTPFVEPDVLFSLSGAGGTTGVKYDTSEEAILFFIGNTEVGRMIK